MCKENVNTNVCFMKENSTRVYPKVPGLSQ